MPSIHDDYDNTRPDLEIMILLVSGLCVTGAVFVAFNFIWLGFFFPVAASAFLTAQVVVTRFSDLALEAIDLCEIQALDHPLPEYQDRISKSDASGRQSSTLPPPRSESGK